MNTSYIWYRNQLCNIWLPYMYGIFQSLDACPPGVLLQLVCNPVTKRFSFRCVVWNLSAIQSLSACPLGIFALCLQSSHRALIHPAGLATLCCNNRCVARSTGLRWIPIHRRWPYMLIEAYGWSRTDRRLAMHRVAVPFLTTMMQFGIHSGHSSLNKCPDVYYRLGYTAATYGTSGVLALFTGVQMLGGVSNRVAIESTWIDPFSSQTLLLF